MDDMRDVAKQLADMGTREVVFKGGEAYLHPDWLDIISMVAAHGSRHRSHEPSSRHTGTLAPALRHAGVGPTLGRHGEGRAGARCDRDRRE
ncbi:MAG: MoaA/NifB/PqqE/SkfB family radical SAM enzyme [Myxococcota bacterium]|jgi:MoaA/NifB/PqqE/SkfB family radical SAM enzyme